MASTAKRPSATESDRRRHAVCVSQIGYVRHDGRPDAVLIGDATTAGRDRAIALGRP
jgi:hypothetical protein